MFCPHCDGLIPTHDVLLALRPPPGADRLFLVEFEGKAGLIHERDYNPAQMRMWPPGKEINQDHLEHWDWEYADDQVPPVA